MNFLNDAFKNLQKLNEETFDISLASGNTELKDFLDDDEEKTDVLTVIDDEATKQEDVKDSYLGKVILDCNVCHSLIYKDPSEIEIEGEDVNLDEECPYCYSVDGFKVIGQVEPFEKVEDDFEDGDEADESESDDEIEIEDDEEEVEVEDDELTESLDSAVGTDLSKYQKWVDFDMQRYGHISEETDTALKRAGLSLVKDQYGDYEVIAKRAVTESIENLSLETEDTKMEMSSDENGKVTITTEPKRNQEETFEDVSLTDDVDVDEDGETIGELDDETKADIKFNNDDLTDENEGDSEK